MHFRPDFSPGLTVHNAALSGEAGLRQASPSSLSGRMVKVYNSMPQLPVLSVFANTGSRCVDYPVLHYRVGFVLDDF